jgi:CRISPR-associated endonuclease Csn1
MSTNGNDKTILGIDLGANSVGWALVSVRDGSTQGIVRAGSRVFEAGVEGDLESGREQSRNQKRRQARLQRRQIWRRARKSSKIFRILQRWGLLPQGESKLPEQRQQLLTALDLQITTSAWFQNHSKAANVPQPEQVMPYLLRTAAMDEQLDPFHFGRALYHLAQRRGFLSNRKESGKKAKDEKEETGKVKEGIAALHEQIKTTGARTLGEFFSRVDPAAQRIRTRWTARTMYAHEFEAIWDAQARYDAERYTEAKKKALRLALFHQRPLSFPRNLVGECDLEKSQKRAPAHLLLSQRFRLLDKLNNLTVLPPGEKERALTPEERQRVLAELETNGDAKFSALRKLLELKKGARFNLEEGGEEKIPGNRTNSALLKVFEERWEKFAPQEKDAVVEYIWSFEKAGKLKTAAMKRWGLSEAKAEELADTALENDYFSLSRRAMQKVLPSLETGMPYAEARRNLYPEQWAKSEPLPFLPPVLFACKNLRNPAVTRSLTELRKVVNAVIRKHGKPDEIRIELARDLRNSRGERERQWKAGRDNQKLREEAVRKILDSMKGYKPSGTEILRVRLAQECGWKCPYTGNPISMNALVGGETRFDLEHIIPFSRSLDNSFSNLTLCDADHNRNVKKGRTPGEAYGSDADAYQQILERVRAFRSKFRDAKLRRFLMTSEDVSDHLRNFTSRQLNDTRYSTRLAADYLALLYGGRSDAEGKLRIRATAGQVTSMLRDEWKLNVILNDGQTSGGGSVRKSRDDHRHHAVDAIVTALTDDRTIAMLSRAAELAPSAGRRRFAPVQAPWNNFVDSVREEVEKMVVSHRVSKRVRGPLHEETIYSSPLPGSAPLSGKAGKKSAGTFEFRVRKPLVALTANEADAIADPAVKRLVLEKLAQFPGTPPKDVFSAEKDLPFLTAKDGRRIPIRKVRVRKAVPAIPVGKGTKLRHVKPESNHHVEIYAELDEKGRETGWTGAVVPLLDAVRRKQAGDPIFKKDHGPATEYKFSLAPGEAIECLDENRGGRRLFHVRGCTQLSAGSVQIFLAPLEDARQKNEIVEDALYLRPVPNTLKRWEARKVQVTALGDVEESHE